MNIVLNIFFMTMFTLDCQLQTSGAGGSTQQQVDRESNDLGTGAVIDYDGMGRFLDRLVPGLMQKHHIPGVTVAVVKDGAILFANGYGYASLEKKIPVDPDQALFRIASVTKLFTWTAVMQLVEEGRLDPDADINEYLTTFKIPNDYPEPITLANLMSHTAGLEDRGLIGTLAHHPDGVVPLEQFLANNMPARVRPPGGVSAYSNYGGALAGYIVAQVSGLPYDQYLQEKIFAPLGMNHATALQSASLEDMASSYFYEEGIHRPVPFAYVIPVPEGGISASAESMSRFMIAHLECGKFQGNAILRPETSREMLQQSFTHHPQLPGWAHGFEEKRINGRRTLEHGGLLSNFTSLLILVPTERLGLFVSFNSRGGSRAGRELRTQFFDEFLPATTTPPVPAKSNASATVERLSGFYAPCRSAQTTIAKLGTLVQAAHLSVNVDNSISFLGQNWLRQEDTALFRSATTDDLLAVRGNQKGQVEYVFIGTSAWSRLPWYQTPVFQLPFLGSCLLTFLSTLVVWPVSRFRARGFGMNAGSATKLPSAARWTASVCSMINLVFVTALAMILSSDTSILEFGVPLSLRLLLTLPIVSAVLALVVMIYSAVSWNQEWWSRLERFHYACVSLASAAFVWFLGFWNLLGWHF